jgi:UDP-N-acetylmuramoyl-L-alanyl-D-glutamate--2,6-diaminopimelate ligase
MEATSMASVKGRLEGTRFAVLAFTNLTQDHLDFHGTMDEYYEAKRRLFAQASRAVINVGDDYGARLAAELPDATTFSPDDDLGDIELKLRWTLSTSRTHSRRQPPRARSASTSARSRRGSRRRTRPGPLRRGRRGPALHRPRRLRPHPGALEAALESARAITRGRLICVFGAGGDRDREKRPLMGQVVAALADVVLVTSDNPRSEDPAAIAADVVDGLDLDVELDRRVAIERALEQAREGDVVLIAGKGHEQGQEVAGRKLPFDDREVARDALRRLKAPA